MTALEKTDYTEIKDAILKRAERFAAVLPLHLAAFATAGVRDEGFGRPFGILYARFLHLPFHELF
jgi:hypothetical protein